METITDCIGDLTIETAEVSTDKVITLVITPGFEPMLDDMLDTLQAFGSSQDATIAVFCVNGSYDALKERDGMIRIKVTSPRPPDINIRTVLYAAHRALRGPNTFLALEPDMLIVGSLRPLWDWIESQPLSTLAGVQPMGETIHPWHHVITTYGLPQKDREEEIALVAGERRDEPYRLNGAVLLGKRRAWERLEGGMNEVTPEIKQWMLGEIGWAEESVMNLAANKYCTVFNLDRRWNQMFYSSTLKERELWLMTEYTHDGVRYHGENGPSRILHFPHLGKPCREAILCEIWTHGLDMQGAL